MPVGEQRDQLTEMARTWDSLAEDRDRVLRKDLMGRLIAGRYASSFSRASRLDPRVRVEGA